MISRQDIPGRKSARDSILESDFCKINGITDLNALNTLGTVFGIEGKHERFVAKLCDHRHDEIVINNLLAKTCQRLSAPLMAAEDSGVAIFARCEEYILDLARSYNDQRLENDLYNAAALLSRIHFIALDEGIGNSRPKVQVGRFHEISFDDYLNLPGFEINTYVEAAQAMNRHLSYVNKVPTTCFIHGDFKVDNIMIWQGQLVAIDWESAGRGHREADLGIFIGCIVSIWLKEKAISYSGDIARILSMGDVGLKQCVLAISQFLARYCSNTVSKLNYRLLGIYAGYFLLDRGLVANILGGRFNLETTMCFKLGQLLISQPIKIVKICKGLVQDELGA